MPGGASITSGGCCVNPARLTVELPAARLTVGSGSGTAVLKFVALGGAGHVVLAGPSQWYSLPSVGFGLTATVTGHGTVTGAFTPYLATFTPGGAFAVHGTASLTGTLVTNTAIDRNRGGDVGWHVTQFVGDRREDHRVVGDRALRVCVHAGSDPGLRGDDDGAQRDRGDRSGLSGLCHGHQAQRPL